MFWCLADSCSVSQAIDHLLWTLKLHYYVHKSPPQNPIPSNVNPVHTLTSYSFKIYFNIILPSMLCSYVYQWKFTSTVFRFNTIDTMVLYIYGYCSFILNYKKLIFHIYAINNSKVMWMKMKHSCLLLECQLSIHLVCVAKIMKNTLLWEKEILKPSWVRNKHHTY